MRGGPKILEQCALEEVDRDDIFTVEKVGGEMVVATFEDSTRDGDEVFATCRWVGPEEMEASVDGIIRIL